MVALKQLEKKPFSPVEGHEHGGDAVVVTSGDDDSLLKLEKFH